MNRESIQNSDFQMNRESTIHKHYWIVPALELSESELWFEIGWFGLEVHLIGFGINQEGFKIGIHESFLNYGSICCGNDLKNYFLIANLIIIF